MTDRVEVAKDATRSRHVEDKGHFIAVGVGFNLSKEDYAAIIQAADAMMREFGTPSEANMVREAMIEVAIHKRGSGFGSGRGWVRGLRTLAQTLNVITRRSR